MTPQIVYDTAILPAAQRLGIATLPHLQIGFGTAANESDFRDIHQLHGTALGIFQMEPGTHASLWKNFIRYRPHLQDAFDALLGSVPPSLDLLSVNLVYSGMMMFCKYLDAPGAIPVDLEGQAEYYKKWYNTAGGAATVKEYKDKYDLYSKGINWRIK